MNFDEIWRQPLFGIAVTVAFYAASLALSQRWRWLHPLFLTSASLILLLQIGHIPYQSYKIGGDYLTFLLGPATVALAVPLYKHAPRLGQHLGAILCGVTLGCIGGIASAGLGAYFLGGSPQVVISMMPKSVTAAVSIEIMKQMGQRPELAAVFTVLTGLLGSMIGPPLLRKIGVRDDLSIGIAIGTAAHGIGTARVIRDSEAQGSASAFAMSLAGIITSLLFIPIAHYWPR